MFGHVVLSCNISMNDVHTLYFITWGGGGGAGGKLQRGVTGLTPAKIFLF